MEYALFRLLLRVILFSGALFILVICIVKKRKLLQRVIFKDKTLCQEYSGRNDIYFLRAICIVLLIGAVFMVSFLAEVLLDLPFILKKEYCSLYGYAAEDCKGGADVDYERRNIKVIKEDGEAVSGITVFSDYIEKGEYMELIYLPHTKYGAVIEKKNGVDGRVKM